MEKNNDNNFHNQLDPLEVLVKARRLKKNNRYFASIFRRSPARISQAFDGGAPLLLKKIDRHCDLLEEKK